MSGTRSKITVGIASPVELRHVQRIASVDPHRVRVLFRPDLLPPMTYAADHTGPAGWTRNEQQQKDWAALLAQAEVLWDFPRDHTDPIAEAAPGLRWVQTTFAGAGPLAQRLRVDETDIIVTTPSGVHAGPLAEFVFAAILHHTKLIGTLQQWQHEKHWERYGAGELRDRTITIVGPGRIGQEVARIARAFRMKTIAVGTRNQAGREDELGVDRYVSLSELDDALAQANYVVLCCPHTPETDGLIDPGRIARMRDGVVLVNIARGAVVDETAMIDSLRSGHIAFAALDVFQTEPLPAESPLWEMPNVLVSPHSASTVVAENERITDIFIKNLKYYLEGRYDKMAPRLDVRRGY